MKPKDVSRFLDKYIPEPNSGCWLWTSAIDAWGYGRFNLGGINELAHCLSFKLHGGAVSSKEVVRHRCDNPCCINPDHLIVGTQADNMEDMKRRNRSRLGERCAKAKLTEPLVRMIRESRKSPSALGRELGLHHSTIQAVLTRRTWGHVL